MPRAISDIKSKAVVRVVGSWRTVGVRLGEEQVAQLNQRLQKLGYATLGEIVGGLADGVIINKQIVGDLADVLSDRIVVKMSTSRQVAPTLFLNEREEKCGRRDLNPGYKLGGLVS